MSKHMTQENRSAIEEGLNRGESFAEIAEKIGKDRTTVSREVKNHRVVSNVSGYGRIANRCIHRKDCGIYGLCENCKHGDGRFCRTCNLCNDYCADFEEEHCTRLMQPPYVCNGCIDRHACVLRKFVYDPRKAQQEYRATLIDLRIGFNLSDQELTQVDHIVSPLILQGQSIHHIWIHHANELPVCERTIQRLLDCKMLNAGIMDQQRKCRLKPRKAKRNDLKIDSKCRIGRTYEDYERYIVENKVSSIVQMDTVYGSAGGKVLFTMIFTKAELMLAFLCDARTAACIRDKLKFLWDGLGEETFTMLFQVLLTDNGSEFSDPKAIELRKDGTQRTHIFYCDPGASYQKGIVERNHEFIRLFLPQGTTFDNLSQAQINLMMSHINSYARPVLNDKTPFEMFAFLYGQEYLDQLLRLLCLTVIPPDEIFLKRSILANG